MATVGIWTAQERRGHTLIVTMNRPAARNALSTEMMRIMAQAWDRVDNDPDIRQAISPTGLLLRRHNSAMRQPRNRRATLSRTAATACRASMPPLKGLLDQTADRRRRGARDRRRHRDPGTDIRRR